MPTAAVSRAAMVFVGGDHRRSKLLAAPRGIGKIVR